MNIKLLFAISILIFLTSCSTYENQRVKKGNEKIYYSASGFALTYDDVLYKDKIINKKMSNNGLFAFHRNLKKNTLVKIINPQNFKEIDVKINKRANYPKIFNIVISNEVSRILNLDNENPLVEVIELKKNKKFVAKEGTIFEEEKNVADKAPVDEIVMDDLTLSKIKKNKKELDKKFILVISDFYYEDSAVNLKNELNKKIQQKTIMIKKINNNKYRLLAGPFESFNALKNTYISLNNLGFEDLNIYKE